jgi:uncharacterized tellurite resistance protein B-like protein
MRPAGWGEPEAPVFEAIKSFVADLASGERQGSGFDQDEFRVAMAALLVHAASIDGDFAKIERSRLTALLKQRFDLDDVAAAELVEQASAADRAAIDLYQFTHVLGRTLDAHERARMIEMMWEIAYADGVLSEFEDHLIWRVADLLGVSSHERIALRQRVAAARASGGA